MLINRAANHGLSDIYLASNSCCKLQLEPVVLPMMHLHDFD